MARRWFLGNDSEQHSADGLTRIDHVGVARWNVIVGGRHVATSLVRSAARELIRAAKRSA